ncbi:MAG: hypothetical protein COB53_04045 [Elusimicrobia bacterium]|nr:MAG: hypothetical protein COB53_04045 [Elusimicrobiota bacterium]
MTPSRSICKPALAAVLLMMAMGTAAKTKRLSSSNGRFSYTLPQGLAAATLKNAIAGWKHQKDRTTLGIFPVSYERKSKLKSAFMAATASRKKATRKEGDWFVSKVYKKTLGNGLIFYFYSAHQHGKFMKVSGYFVLGGDYYFVSGWTSRKKYGLPNVYASLSTIKPIAGPRRNRSMKDHDSEGLLNRHRKKKKSPEVRLGTGSDTPKMLGGGPVH